MDARERRLHAARGPLGRFLAILGPGLVTGASDDDPSGIGTYAAAGAAFGYPILWTALITFPMMAAVQFLCAKIGMVTGRGLAGVLRKHYPRWVLVVTVLALFVANAVNAGADIGAIADALRLLAPVPSAPLILAIAAGLVLLQLYGDYRLVARVFRWLTLALFGYVGAALFARPDGAAVLRGTLVPVILPTREFIAMLVALLGTTISPYLFFWQASQEVEEEITVGRTSVHKRRGATDSEVRYAALDNNTGMAFSNLVMYFTILATAATLHRAGHTHVRTAAEAAQALRPLAGSAATVLLALGMAGAGLLAVPVLTGSAAYAVAEAFGWRHSLSAKPRQARAFYAVIVASTVIGLGVNFVGIAPFDALVGSSILNGVLAPFLLLLVMRVGDDRRIMGRWAGGHWTRPLGWITTVAMAAAAVALLLTLR